MQLLFDQGEEIRETQGLGLVPGKVKWIETSLKLPHIGWNSLTFPNASPLFAGLDEGSYVYFVHSFCGNAADLKYVIASTDYGISVTAAVQNGTVFGTQFHPEKSGEVGMEILRNFGGLTR
jgi:glutamine amidotransferase